MDFPCVLPENLADCFQVLRTSHHEIACPALGDLNVALEQRGVLKAEVECSDGHALRDGAKVVDGLVAEAGEVKEAVVCAAESEEDHFRAAGECLVAVRWVEEIVELLDVLGPDFTRPEVALENMSRVLPAQIKHISFTPGGRYQPVKKVRLKYT